MPRTVPSRMPDAMSNSPEQIARRLRRPFPDDAEMRVSTRASGVLKRVGRRPRGCPHRDTSLCEVCEERAAADRGRF